MVFCLNWHFCFIIGKTEHLLRFVGHSYFLSTSLTCCRRVGFLGLCVQLKLQLTRLLPLLQIIPPRETVTCNILRERSLGAAGRGVP